MSFLDTLLLNTSTNICIAVGDPIIKRGGLGSHKSFNTTTFVCLSQARTWISNVVMCCGLFVFNALRWEVIVCFLDICGIDDHNCLTFLFITCKFAHFLTWLLEEVVTLSSCDFYLVAMIPMLPLYPIQKWQILTIHKQFLFDQFKTSYITTAYFTIKKNQCWVLL